MIIACSDLFERQYKQMIIFFVLFCKKSPSRYYLNLLRTIELFYHLYIQHEIYNLEYNKNTGFINDSIFIQRKMGKWDDHYTFLKIIII